jgi:hypothetical protein
MLALKVAKGAELELVQQQGGKLVFISPVADLWGFGAFLIELFAEKVLGHHPLDPDNSSPSWSEVLGSYKNTYSAPNKVLDPFLTHFLQDPLVSLTWWAAFGVFNLQQKLPRIRS